MVFALWDRAKLAADSGVEDAGGWGGVTLAYLVRLARGGRRGARRARKAAGGSVPRAGGKTFWGGYSGIFVDPEGHPWEVAHNPGWTLQRRRHGQPELTVPEVRCGAAAARAAPSGRYDSSPSGSRSSAQLLMQ